MRVLGSSAAWRYIATNSGAMRQYPGRQTYNNRSAEKLSLSSCHELRTERVGREGSSYIKLRAYPCLNSPKCPFHISLARAKPFEILIVSTASRNRFMKMLKQAGFPTIG